MKNIEVENLQKAASFVDAIQKDYEKLSIEEKRDAWIAISEIAGFGFTGEDIDFIKPLRLSWNDFFENIIKNREMYSVIKFQISMTAYIQKDVGFQILEDISIEDYDSPAQYVVSDIHLGRFVEKHWGKDKSEVPENEIPHVESYKLHVPPGIYKFFNLLKGQSIDVFLQCPVCEKFFINTSKRKTVYCSPACRTLANIHKFRAKKRAEKKGGGK